MPVRRTILIGITLGLVAFRMGIRASAAQSQTSLPPASQAGKFRFSTRDYSRYNGVFLGNGRLFVATPWNGVSGSETAIAGLYDHLEQESYPYQALIPAWNEVDYWDGSKWLNAGSPETFRASGYLQELDAYHGLLSTRYDWLNNGRRTGVEARIFVCRQNPHLGVVRFQVTPHYGVEVGPVTVSFPVGGNTDAFVWEGAKIPGAIPIRHVQVDQDHRGFVVVATTRDGKQTVAEAVRVTLPADLPEPNVSLGFLPSLKKPALNVKFISRAGRTYSFTKWVAVVSSQESKSPASDAEQIVDAAEEEGYVRVLRTHENAWAQLWQPDIRIQGDVEAERAIHAAMYYLFSSLRRDDDRSLPAMALPSRAYLGRVWWDADTWILPSLLVLHPDLARSIVAYRCHTLSEARLNARRLGYTGALFPMESAGGEAAAPEWGSEIHVAGDVALAQWRYFLATGDRQWLAQCGYPILHDVAEFWVSRVVMNPKTGQYEIRSVTGPNEAIVDVDNDSYTNAVAQQTLEVARKAANLLHETPDPRWDQVASRIFIPFDRRRQRHLEHSGDEQGRYAHALILLTYPLELPFSDQVRRNDLNACLANFGKPGYEVGMLGNFYSIVASQLGDGELAGRLFLSTLESYAKPPFDAMTETPTNGRAVFLTAEGAFLQQIIFGFTGLRFTDQGLAPEYPPQLPPGWQSLELRNIQIRGKRFNVRVERGHQIRITPAVR